MSRIVIAALALSAALAAPALAEGYKVVDRFKMPEGAGTMPAPIPRRAASTGHATKASPT